MNTLNEPCREWQGPVNQQGYGRVTRDRRRVYVHRWVWMLVHGPIPDGLYVCHHCDNPLCFRLSHLYLGTPADNVRDMCERGRHPNAVKTHCRHGHEYTPENTYIIPASGSRSCLTCKEARR